MIRELILILFIAVLFNSCSHSNKLLPEKYEVKEISSSYSWPFDITVYEISNSMDYSDLINYPCFSVDDKYVLRKWKLLNDVDEKDRVCGIVQEAFDSSKNQDVLPLIESINNSNEIYFASLSMLSACDASGKPIRMYEEMYFLDIKDKKIYEFVHNN